MGLLARLSTRVVSSLLMERLFRERPCMSRPSPFESPRSEIHKRREQPHLIIEKQAVFGVYHPSLSHEVSCVGGHSFVQAAHWPQLARACMKLLLWARWADSPALTERITVQCWAA